jgi:hypothetical protein
VCFARTHFEDLHSALLVRQGDLNLPVESSRSKQGGVERVRSVGRHDELRLAERVESVHLVEKLQGTFGQEAKQVRSNCDMHPVHCWTYLHECPLDLSVCTRSL